MADNNKLELVVEVDVNKANASIKSVNASLSSMEQAAAKAARYAGGGIDGFTVSIATPDVRTDSFLRPSAFVPA